MAPIQCQQSLELPLNAERIVDFRCEIFLHLLFFITNSDNPKNKLDLIQEIHSDHFRLVKQVLLFIFICLSESLPFELESLMVVAMEQLH